MPRGRTSIDPRIQILYLVAVAVVAFATSHLALLLGLLALQVALWLWNRLPLVNLARALRRLAVFVAFVLLSYAFLSGQEGDRIVHLVRFGVSLPVNLTGLATGVILSTRIVTVIYASQLVRQSGGGMALVRGLRGLGVPAFVAYGVDLVLALLGSADAPRGTGERKRGVGAAAVLIKHALRGNVGFLIDGVGRSIARARTMGEQYGLKPVELNDLAVISGLSVLGMTLRFLKVMPGLPVAPGHKGIILIPFYILASELTASRWGSTKMGVVMGATGFLVGEGKFGIFEMFRHITPGIFVDLVMPVVRRAARTPGALLYALIGIGVALTRLSTLVVVAYFVQAPAVFYAFLTPMAIAQTAFGFLSGFVTFHLMKSLGAIRAAIDR